MTESTMTAAEVEAALFEKRNETKAAFFPRFFRTGPGEYGEGDQFIGVVVPDQRKIANKFWRLPLEDVELLLDSPLHECRLTSLLILVKQYEKAKETKLQNKLYQFYKRKVDRVNNWDLVDSSCHKIMGPHLMEKDRKPLYQFAKAKHLWKNRIAIVTTYYFIRRDDFGTTLDLSRLLIDHPHDLIHKAVGWMLREMGKLNEGLLLDFLQQHHDQMPRTMLRYSIEKFPKPQRDRLLRGEF